MISMEREREKAFRERQRSESYGQTPTHNIHDKEPKSIRADRGAGYNPAFQPRSMNHQSSSAIDIVNKDHAPWRLGGM